MPPTPQTAPVGIPRPVDRLQAVERVREGGRERQGIVGLDRNERLSPLPEWFMETVRGSLASTDLTRYPNTDGLYDQLADVLGVARGRVLLTAGSDAAVKAIYQCYARPGDRAVMLDPSYAMYPIYARMFDVEPMQIPFGPDRRLDGEALLNGISEGVRLVLLAEPNQPTGTSLGGRLLLAAIRRAGEVGALVLVDEAYHPFSGTTVLGLLEEHPHLIVTRTFSKAWGMAGLRAGIALAAPEIIQTLYKVRSAYDLNAMAALCLGIALAHPEIASDYVAEVDAGRTVLAARTRALGLEPLEGATNFQLLALAGRADPQSLVTALAERGYIVKGPFSAPCLADCIRVTLGPPELMERFADVLEKVLDET